MKPTSDELDVLIEYAQGRLSDWNDAPNAGSDLLGECVAEDYQLLEALQYLKENL